MTMSNLETFVRAWGELALAGRELGSGIAVAVEPVVGEDVIRRLEIMLMARKDSEEAAKLVALGIALGLIMSKDDDATAKLEEIYKTWLDNQ